MPIASHRRMTIILCLIKNLTNHYSTNIISQKIFDRKSKCIQKSRAFKNPRRNTYDYIRYCVADNLADRMYDINREHQFALELGCSSSKILAQKLDTNLVKYLFQTDSCREAYIKYEVYNSSRTLPIIIDDESISFRDNTFDIAISSLNLHWINNLQDLFQRVNKLLQKDCPFLVSIFGKHTLFELRTSLQEAEIQICNGFASRISPFMEMQDLGSLFSNCNFKLVSIDSDEIVVRYPGIVELMTDLHYMGESNCTYNRNHYIRRDVIEKAGQIYRDRFSSGDGNICATFVIFYGLGWTYSETQSKAKKKGSSNVTFDQLSKMLPNR